MCWLGLARFDRAYPAGFASPFQQGYTGARRCASLTDGPLVLSWWRLKAALSFWRCLLFESSSSWVFRLLFQANLAWCDLPRIAWKLKLPLNLSSRLKSDCQVVLEWRHWIDPCMVTKPIWRHRNPREGGSGTGTPGTTLERYSLMETKINAASFDSVRPKVAKENTYLWTYLFVLLHLTPVLKPMHWLPVTF